MTSWPHRCYAGKLAWYQLQSDFQTDRGGRRAVDCVQWRIQHIYQVQCFIWSSIICSSYDHHLIIVIWSSSSYHPSSDHIWSSDDHSHLIIIIWSSWSDHRHLIIVIWLSSCHHLMIKLSKLTKKWVIHERKQRRVWRRVDEQREHHVFSSGGHQENVREGPKQQPLPNIKSSSTPKQRVASGENDIWRLTMKRREEARGQILRKSDKSP